MTSPTLADLGEWDWLAKVRSKLSDPSSPELVVPIGDDAAVWSPEPGLSWIATCDAHCEGTHFQKSWLDWAGLARRSLLAAASDITAMGGTPRGFLISLGAPGATPVHGLEAFAEEVSRLSHQYHLWPMGGDTFRSDRVVVDVTVLGAAQEGDILRQSGAKPGDAIWVTGWLGMMRAAWTSLSEKGGGDESIGKRFWDPPARWPSLGRLRETLSIGAMTDLSDGLACDLRKVLEREDLGAEIELDRLPVEPAARIFFEVRDLSPHEESFAGGEDFELLIVEAGDSGGQGSALIEGVPLTRIGRVTGEGEEIRTTLNGSNHEVTVQGFEHFSS